MSDSIKNILSNYQFPGVQLVAVSKNQPVPKILSVYQAGQRDFGENRVQELLLKIPQLPKDIRWHLIGHLQSNKVSSIIGKVACIHSVDSKKLLNCINEESGKQNVITPLLLQLKISPTETKYGLSEELLMEIVDQQVRTNAWPSVQFKGMMAMATLTDVLFQIRDEMQRARICFQRVQQQYGKKLEDWSTLSMGMSSDYVPAIECGSNLIRIGSKLFEAIPNAE